MENSELTKYISLAKMIAATFGSSCEVVLHDLTRPQSSVVFTANNCVTGRQIGQSFDHLIRNVLVASDFFQDFRANYQIASQDGRVIKSSTCLLRGAENKVIGALCINLDVTAFVHCQSVVQEMIQIDQDTDSGSEDRSVQESVMQIMNQLISNILSTDDPDKLSRSERIERIGFMDSKGIFMIKGAVDEVANRMKVSQVTVYSYLDEARKNNRK